MAGLRYTDIQSKPHEVQDLTSLTVAEFEILVPVFETAFQSYMSQWRLDGRPRTARQYTTYANCPLPAPEDRLLFILLYLKTNPLQVLHGRLFGLPQCKANQWIHVLLPVLRATLVGLGDAPSQTVSDLAERLGVTGQPAEPASAATAVPLFVTTAPNAASRARPMRLNKKAVIAARKNVIP